MPALALLALRNWFRGVTVYRAVVVDERNAREISLIRAGAFCWFRGGEVRRELPAGAIFIGALAPLLRKVCHRSAIRFPAKVSNAPTRINGNAIVFRITRTTPFPLDVCLVILSYLFLLVSGLCNARSF